MSNESRLLYVRDCATAYINDVPAKKVYRKDLNTGEKFTDFSADDIKWLIDAFIESESRISSMQSEIDNLKFRIEQLDFLVQSYAKQALNLSHQNDSLRADNERILNKLLSDQVISIGIDKLTERGELTIDQSDLIYCLKEMIESAKTLD